MDVILLERVDKLGAMGEVVKVKAGYARNYPFPQGKALRATDANKAKLSATASTLEAKSADAAPGRRRAIPASSKARASSSCARPANRASSTARSRPAISPRPRPGPASRSRATRCCSTRRSRRSASTRCRSRSTPRCVVPVTLNVARSQDEADAQSRGEVLTGPVSERAEAWPAAEELFEAEALGPSGRGRAK